jgi:hypothetical protein
MFDSGSIRKLAIERPEQRNFTSLREDNKGYSASISPAHESDTFAFPRFCEVEIVVNGGPEEHS